MSILGAHQSIAGGYYLAVQRAKQRGCDCVQLFTKNNTQWSARPITGEDVRRFRAALEEHGIRQPIAHDSYLINLASPDLRLWKKSVAALIEELGRAEKLGIACVVTHPGAFTTGSESHGLRRVIRALNEILGQTEDLAAQLLLETTAGQGTSLGWRFEQLAAMLDGARQSDRLGVCFDTCHVFAAGYPLAGKHEYRATMRAFDRAVGLERIRAFHLNDSRQELGSRIDRHQHIGRGAIGLEGFRNLLRDRRFQHVPMYLETPKGEENGADLDTINLQVLRQLATDLPDRVTGKSR